MSTPRSADPLGRHRILVADEEVVAFIIETLRGDGHCVFHAYDGLSATELTGALDEVHHVISNTKLSGLPVIELIYQLRTQLPNLPILRIANTDRSTPTTEAKPPRDVPILREPFTAEQLRAFVNALLSGKPSLLDIGG
jgi:DNA-binding response OmpR family regulator